MLILVHVTRKAPTRRSAPTKIDVAAIHHIDGSGVRHDQIECCSIAHFPSEMWIKPGFAARRPSSVCIFTAALVEQKLAHGKQQQAQIDRCAIESINRIDEIEPNIIADV
jgi:hypothetical protein